MNTPGEAWKVSLCVVMGGRQKGGDTVYKHTRGGRKEAILDEGSQGSLSHSALPRAGDQSIQCQYSSSYETLMSDQCKLKIGHCPHPCPPPQYVYLFPAWCYLTSPHLTTHDKISQDLSHCIDKSCRRQRPRNKATRHVVHHQWFPLPSPKKLQSSAPLNRM